MINGSCEATTANFPLPAHNYFKSNHEPLKISNNNFSSSGVSNISVYGGHLKDIRWRMSPPVGINANYRDNYFSFGFGTSPNDRMEDFWRICQFVKASGVEEK